MLRTTAPPTLWDTILPPQALRMPAELEAVDRLLDDARFFEPFVAHFDPTHGRPSVPIATFLRLAFLKYRFELGWEPLCELVADSITFRRFCRIPLCEPVPHPTTLMKITTRCGPDAVAGLHQRLVAKAVDEHDLEVDDIRADTTVVEANVAYPTDSGLLAKAVRRIAATVKRMQAAGGATRTHVRDRSRAASRRARSIGANLKRRTREAKQAVARLTGELADLAEKAACDADRALSNARRSLRRRGGSGWLRRAVDDLATLLERTRRIVAQTRLRLAGTTPDGATRLVSLHDPDARPIVKGRLGRPVEFGYTAQVVDNTAGIVLDYQIEIGNPPDAPMLTPAVQRVIDLTGQTPTAVAADRGYGDADTHRKVTNLGVDRVAIPRKGRPSKARRAVQAADWFRRLVKWRTGAEGRISCLKRDFGWARTMLDGITGARTWCGYGIFNHNLVKLAAA